MSEVSLDDQFKSAQIEKTLAEARKLDREADVAMKQARTASWSDVIKVFGGIVLGIGGAVAAFTQFEVAELKAKIAKQELSQAEKLKAEAKASAERSKKESQEAEASAAKALAKRDTAIREQRDGPS